MGWALICKGNQSNPISGAVIETFIILYENLNLDFLKAPLRTVHVVLFVSIDGLACTLNKL